MDITLTSTARQPSPADEPLIDVGTLQSELAGAGVRYAAISFVDVHGKPKAKIVPLDHLGAAVSGSELFTGAALDAVPQEVNDDEVSAVPDLGGGIAMPWQPDVTWFPSDLQLNGSPFEACSRQILKRSVAHAAELGFVFNLGVETEFFILRDGEKGPEPIEESDSLAKPCYDLRSLLRTFPVVDELVTTMNALGWGVYSFDHEDGNGQFEIDFSYTDAVASADRLTFFKLMLGEITRRHGVYGTFMPKPFANQTGSGAHMNMSLADSHGVNLFEDRADPRGCGLSTLGYQFTAGVLRHASSISAVIAPTVNSYKRLVKSGSASGFTWAPVFGTYGDNNRTNMVRIPMGGGRVECRAADSSMNPYLAAAVVLAAGLEGIREQLDPGPPNTDNLYLLSDAELSARGISSLPRTLLEAVEAFQDDPLCLDVMGPQMHRAFAEQKLREWEEFHTHVSQWERDRYLKFF
ncbi:type III glutamate--ammonia ligase [Streptomyces sp. NPDC006602]|uniref:type III glutamate--ammonia ligase n=1 Tax=Streptomyces sp. NPDC006602 TaxID=3364751 RepID=UPI0036A921C8